MFRTGRVSFACGALAAGGGAARAEAQAYGFVVTLGADTVQVERVVKSGNRVDGTLVLRTPVTRRVSYSATFDAGGRMARFEQSVADGDGRPLGPDPGPSVMTVAGDSIFRESGPTDRRTIVSAAAPGGAFPLGTIPVGTLFGIWETATSRVRGVALSDNPTINRIQPAGTRLFFSQTAVKYSSQDSVEMDYFSQGRAGFRFDRDGRLVRSDWSGTTYHILAQRVESVDVDSYARAWSAEDKRGASFGTQYNPRKDFARVPLTVDRTSERVERLTIAIRGETPALEWDNSRYSVRFRGNP